MAHPNATMLRTAYDAVSTGDLGPMLAMLSDDIHWNVAGDSPLAGEYHGREGVVEFFGRMADVYEGTLRVAIVDVLANERRGIVLTSESATLDGRELEWTSAHVYAIDGGSAVGFTSYQDDAYHAIWQRVA